MNTHAHLSQFIGTEAYYSLAPLSGLKITDGVKAVADNDGHWFVMDTAIQASHDEKLKNQDFLAVDLIVGDNKAEVVIGDGNDNILFTRQYTPIEGFEDGKYSFYIYGGVFLLASEY